VQKKYHRFWGSLLRPPRTKGASDGSRSYSFF
jgi:hypothetical protein